IARTRTQHVASYENREVKRSGCRKNLTIAIAMLYLIFLEVENIKLPLHSRHSITFLKNLKEQIKNNFIHSSLRNSEKLLRLELRRIYPLDMTTTLMI